MLVAMVAMAMLSKTRQQQGQGGFAQSLASALDQNGNGNPIDDILGMLAGGGRAA